MSDESPLGPELLADLLRQAQWKRDQEKAEASLTPAEKALRARFEKALFGPPGPLELAEFRVSDPTTLLVFAEAYRWEGIYKAHGKQIKEARAIREPYEVAMHLLVLIWMAVRGHTEAERMLAQRRKMPMIPLLPRDWHRYRARVYAGMGLEPPPEPSVPVLRTPLTAGMQAI